MAADADKKTPSDEIAELRINTIRALTAVFDVIEQAADSTTFDRVVALAQKYEEERDAALARVTQLESEVAELKGKANVLPEHTATVIDAAVTLRNTVAGIAGTPITTAPQARVIGQANKAVEAFNEQTKGML